MEELRKLPRSENINGQTKEEFSEWIKGLLKESGIEGDPLSIIEREYAHHTRLQKYANDKYVVSVDKKCDHIHPNWPEELPCWYISFSMRDGGHLLDWREIQEIKNQVLGPEYECVMLWPKESRVLDTANQFHMYAIGRPGIEFPVGYQTERAVRDDMNGKHSISQRTIN